MPKIDHIVYVLVAFLATLGCFTAVALVGADASGTLRDVLLALGGAVAGVAIGKAAP